MAKKKGYGMCQCGEPADRWLKEGVFVGVCRRELCYEISDKENQEHIKRDIEEMNRIWPEQ